MWNSIVSHLIDHWVSIIYKNYLGTQYRTYSIALLHFVFEPSNLDSVLKFPVPLWYKNILHQ